MGGQRQYITSVVTKLVSDGGQRPYITSMVTKLIGVQFRQ